MSGVRREKKSVREGETESQWRVVVRRKPSSHWRQGPSHAYNGPAIARQWRGGHKAIEQGEHKEWKEIHSLFLLITFRRMLRTNGCGRCSVTRERLWIFFYPGRSGKATH
ncbi:hypothetical protein PIB30_071726 [Stylosanthes scabra]|uniref:Uncharacterized protein n=1 Tax=Stylosanthes scabra TaxID=79078 RepID=A0ABU6TNL1_9FABA|nr:hypothetical protein [Stylosanthes scabra]